MATYAIGDVQGCFAALQELLVLIQFEPEKDRLWFVGDLVNRGSQSLEVLRFVKSLGSNHHTVLGNHDLHLIALAYGASTLQPGDTLAPILAAPDRDELITWLRHCPLLFADGDYVMAHAGLAPSWDLAQAQRCAREVEVVLQGDAPELFLQQMYGNHPDFWQEDLFGVPRLRCITNYFTRMRFCDANGRLDLAYQGDLANKPVGLVPWFAVKPRMNTEVKIIFGHWAALGGKTDMANIYPLDTGCVWGNCLTAMRLADHKRFSVACPSIRSKQIKS